MSKKIVIDFDNNMVFFDIPSQKGTEYNNELDKLKIINSIGDLDAEIYMKLCKSGIFGFDFEKEQIIIYQSIMYDKSSGSLYPVSLLKEKASVSFPGLQQRYDFIVAAMGYHEENLQEDPEFQLICKALAGKLI